jgi:tRNA(Ile)-lysidine synthase
MLARVERTITRYSMFQRGQRVGVAVSGGADSVCLLHVLRELAARWELPLTVLHLDHKLRGEESRQDAEFVRELAAAFGLPFVLREVDIAAMCRDGGENIEQAARRTRLEFFHSQLSAGLERVAVGHTRSDQAETVLFRFLRGSGTAGLSGIRPVTAEGIVRPLLDVERAEIEQYLRERAIAWREDSSNRSPAFARNRIRQALLPQLTREWNPALSETLAHVADWAQSEESYWEAELARLSLAYLVQKSTAILVSVEPLNELPAAVARRLVRRAVELAKGDLRGIGFQHLAAILELASATEGHGRLQVPGLDIFRSFDWLRLAPPEEEGLASRNYRLLLPVPGRATLPGGSLIHAELFENITVTKASTDVYNEDVTCLDWNRISGSLEVRNWRPGDQYQPASRSGPEKIKFLFHQARIPLWERRHWPVITAGDVIVWARRFGPDAGFAAGADSGPVLSIRESGL